MGGGSEPSPIFFLTTKLVCINVNAKPGSHILNCLII